MKKLRVPIFLDYGFLAVPVRRAKTFDPPHSDQPYVYRYDEPILLIADNADGPVFKIIDDIRKDQIWLLRKGSSAQIDNRHGPVLRLEPTRRRSIGQ